MRSVVVFPHPEGPRRAKKCPGWISSETSSTAITSSNCFVTPSSRTSGVPLLATRRSVSVSAAIDAGICCPLVRHDEHGPIRDLEELVRHRAKDRAPDRALAVRPDGEEGGDGPLRDELDISLDSGRPRALQGRAGYLLTELFEGLLVHLPLLSH